MRASSRTARASAAKAFRTGIGAAWPRPQIEVTRHRLEPLVDLVPRHRRAPVLELLGDVVERPVADPARSALLARLLGEEAHRLREQAERGVGAREDLDGGGADAAAPLGERLARQRHVERGGREDPARGAAGHDRARLGGQAACVVVDQVSERDVERRLVAARLRDGAGDGPEAGRLPAATEDERDVGQRLDVVDQRRPAEVAGLAREGWLQPRHPAPALHRLEHRRLLAADVRAGADDELAPGRRAPRSPPAGARERCRTPRGGRCRPRSVSQKRIAATSPSSRSCGRSSIT